MASVIALLESTLLILLIAAGVRIVASRLRTVSYTVMLMLAGVLASLLGVRFAIDLSHDLILFVLLPVILFFGAVELDTERYRRNLPVPVALVVVGLPAAVLLTGLGTAQLTRLPLVAALLFASMIYPVDPVAVIALFNEMDAPERILVLTEGESLLDDGFGVVFFSTVLAIFQRHAGGTPLEDIVTLGWLGGVAVDLAVASLGGLLAGFGVGYVGLRLLTTPLVDERMTELLVTVIVAFGAFVFAHHYLGVSGVLATVAVGLLAGVSGTETSLTYGSFEFLEQVWKSGEFLVKTLLFLLIGSEVRVDHLVEHAWLVAAGAVLVLLARAAVVYTLVPVVNRLFLSDPIPRSVQHVQVWGAMHTVVPIALVLSLPEGVPYHEELRTMVFGGAVTSVLVQGLLMPSVLRATGVVEAGRREETERQERKRTPSGE